MKPLKTTTIVALLLFCNAIGTITGQNPNNGIQIINNKKNTEKFYLYPFQSALPADSFTVESGQSAMAFTESFYPLYSISDEHSRSAKFLFFKKKEESITLLVSASGIVATGSQLDSNWRAAMSQQDTMLKRIYPLRGGDTTKNQYLIQKEIYENWGFQKFNTFLAIDTFLALRFLNFHVPKLLQLTEINTVFIDKTIRIIQDEGLSHHPLVKKTDLLNKLESLSYLKVGAMRYDFDFITPNGDTTNTGKLKSSTLLIDFGASWCKPCREKNLEIKKVFDQIKARGITVVGISLDENKSAWLEYLKKDDLPWLQGILPAARANHVQNKYNAHAIPLSVLFSAEGSILKINPTLAELTH